MNNHSHDNHSGMKNIKTAFLLNISFTILEIIGGILTNSIAILSDALHDLGDSLSLGLSLYLEKVSQRKRDNRFSFGYRRFSLLAALINSIVLIVGSFIIISEAIPRVFNPETVHIKGMFALSIFGILVNSLAAWRVNSGKSMNERVITWHFLEDVFGWIAILIISLVMLKWDIPILDPILSILITVFILWNVAKRLKETAVIFLQAIPPGIEVDKLEACISDLDKVISTHDTHVWSMDGEYTVMSTHIVVSDSLPHSEYLHVKNSVKECCKDVGIHHITVEIERGDEDCHSADC